MSKVRTSAYRQTPTPEGLKAIENGTLDYFDTEMYANFNTEVLEEYLEEKNRGDGFGTTKWKWNQMLLGLGIGIIFAIIISLISVYWFENMMLGLTYQRVLAWNLKTYKRPH